LGEYILIDTAKLAQIGNNGKRHQRIIRIFPNLSVSLFLIGGMMVTVTIAYRQTLK
jgi:hypothetical protein